MRSPFPRRSIPALLTRLAALHPWRSGLVALLIVLVALALAHRCAARDVAVATFNIENFPRDARQVQGAMAAIRELDVPVIAVQEITDPYAFASAARAELGSSWRFVASASGPEQRVGVLYDGDVYRLGWARTHTETQLTERAKPALEARLRRADGGRALRIFVVHLKAGGAFAPARREQLRRLAPIVTDAVGSWDEVMVLGDFNATGPDDRRTIAAFARSVGLSWWSRDVRCTSYWNRSDGCRGVALDHLLGTGDAEVTARGPCASVGCEPGRRCPLFHREVSDHCPVTAAR